MTQAELQALHTRMVQARLNILNIAPPSPSDLEALVALVGRKFVFIVRPEDLANDRPWYVSGQIVGVEDGYGLSRDTVMLTTTAWATDHRAVGHDNVAQTVVFWCGSTGKYDLLEIVRQSSFNVRLVGTLHVP